MKYQPRTTTGRYTSRKEAERQRILKAQQVLAGLMIVPMLYGSLLGILNAPTTQSFVSPAPDNFFTTVNDYRIIGTLFAKEAEEVAASSVLSVDEATSSAGLIEIPPTPTPLPKNVSQHSVKVIREIFGEHADKGIKMLTTCENSTLNPHAINKANRNGTWDVGIWQINVDPANTEEVERLKDPVYNTQRAWAKFTSKGNTFYHWTCGYVVGDYTYLDYLRGKPQN